MRHKWKASPTSAPSRDQCERCGLRRRWHATKGERGWEYCVKDQDTWFRGIAPGCLAKTHNDRATYRQRENAQGNARTALIDALRLCDQGMFPEALVGAAMAVTFLARIAPETRVQDLLEVILQSSVKRRQLAEASGEPDEPT